MASKSPAATDGVWGAPGKRLNSGSPITGLRSKWSYLFVALARPVKGARGLTFPRAPVICVPMNQSTADSRKLYQHVAAAIAEDIARGVYAPGGRLPSERELGERFSVSRPTIREAMLALEIRGMVEARHGSGIYVADNPRAERSAPELDIGAFELTEARALFEGEAAALAATVITEQELDRLEELLKERMDLIKSKRRGS